MSENQPIILQGVACSVSEIPGPPHYVHPPWPPECPAGSHFPPFAHAGSFHSAYPFPKNHHLLEATLIASGQLSQFLSHLGPGRLVLSQPEVPGGQPIPALPVDSSSSGQRGLCLPLKSCLWPYWRSSGRKELKGSGSSSNLGYHPRHQEGCNASASRISGLLDEYRFPGPSVNPENHIYPPGGAQESGF